MLTHSSTVLARTGNTASLGRAKHYNSIKDLSDESAFPECYRRELETSSESDVHSSELEEENFAEEHHKGNWCSDIEISSSTKTGENDDCDYDGTNDGGDMDTLEIGITREEMGELLNDMPCGEASQKKQPGDRRCEKPFKRSKLETTESSKLKRKVSEECTSEQTFTKQQEREETTDKGDKSKGKTLLEILELEMRARAIRALLKQQGEEEGNAQIGLESGTKMKKRGADAIIPDMRRQNTGVFTTNADTKNVDAITTNTVINKTASTEIKENTNLAMKIEETALQPRKRLKRPVTSANLEEKNINTADVICDNDNIEMDLVSMKIEVVDLTKEKQDLKDIKPNENESNKTVLPSQNDKTSNRIDSNSATCKTVELQDKSLYKDMVITNENRTTLDKAKKRCYRSNQEEGEISSDDENKSDAAHTVKIETESDFDVITLDDSNDSICSLPRAERLVTIEKSNLSKLTSVTSATNQRMYSEILRSNIKVFVKNKAKLKTRDIHLDATSLWSKNPKLQTQKGLKETEDGQNQGIARENHAASEMTWTARWLKSKGVQKVVKTSKVCAKMRKRMKNVQKRTQATMQDTREESKSPVHIIGSVREYRMLDKPKVSHSDSKPKLNEEKQQM